MSQRRRVWGVMLLCLLVSFGAAAQKGTTKSRGTVTLPDVSKIDIPYQKFVLSNGLTLLVHEDRKAPIVAVNVWYHVGSKNEPRGRSGFAHLFERELQERLLPGAGAARSDRPQRNHK